MPIIEGSTLRIQQCLKGSFFPNTYIGIIFYYLWFGGEK